MRTFLINLKDRPDRLESFKGQNIPLDITIVDGVKDLDGSLGCIKSHLKCFELFDEGINIILEDDCQQINSIEILYEAIKQLDNDWDMLYLGAMVHGDLKENTKNTDFFSDGWTTHAIAYNGKKVSDYILKFTTETIRATRRNIDTFIVYEIQKNPNFKCYITNPQIFIQDLSYSDIINGIRSYEWKYGNRIN
jgi:GR25 family glycosyltransferase involved in LPS biosynthesis